MRKPEISNQELETEEAAERSKALLEEHVAKIIANNHEWLLCYDTPDRVAAAAIMLPITAKKFAAVAAEAIAHCIVPESVQEIPPNLRRVLTCCEVIRDTMRLAESPKELEDLILILAKTMSEIRAEHKK